MRARHKRTAIAVGIGVPFCAVLGYFVWGNSRTPLPDLAPELNGSAVDRLQSVPASPREKLNSQPMQSRIEALSERLEKNPHDNLQGWITLARSYFAQGRFAQAAAAYAEVVKRSPNEAYLLADYAEALALAQGRSLQGKPERIIQRALVIDPNHIKALGMAGRAAFDRADYPRALELWNRLLSLVRPESEFARKLRGSIADVEARISNDGAGAEPTSMPRAAAAVRSAGVSR